MTTTITMLLIRGVLAAVVVGVAAVMVSNVDPSRRVRLMVGAALTSLTWLPRMLLALAAPRLDSEGALALFLAADLILDLVGYVMLLVGVWLLASAAAGRAAPAPAPVAIGQQVRPPEVRIYPPQGPGRTYPPQSQGQAYPPQGPGQAYPPMGGPYPTPGAGPRA